uniref:Uncharacterized protein n=1 Tax=Globodera rostochiensis TaxID=31243 RepID=A0A914HII1_GLORO
MPSQSPAFIANSLRLFLFIVRTRIFGAALWRDQSDSYTPPTLAGGRLDVVDSSAAAGAMSAHSLRYRKPFYMDAFGVLHSFNSSPLSQHFSVPWHGMGADFLQVFSYFLANVSDFAHPWAYRLHCHSCMSPYLEDQFQFISHLYRRPLAFSEKCDHGQFDWRYIATKNCSDACVTLRMNDRVGGRRRFGFMRGCLSDIIHHNRTAVRFGELGKTTKSGATICSAIRLRDLFISSDRYAFDPHDHIELCACIRSNCNSARPKFCTKNALLATITTFLTFLFLCDGETFPSVPKELPGEAKVGLETFERKGRKTDTEQRPKRGAKRRAKGRHK